MKYRDLVCSTFAAMAVFALPSCEEDTKYDVYQDPTNVEFAVETSTLTFAGNATQAQIAKVRAPKYPAATFNGDFRTAGVHDYTDKYEFWYDVLPKATIGASLNGREQSIELKMGDKTQTIKVVQNKVEAGFLGLGWNLGNHFDTSNMDWGYWDGATPTAATYEGVKAAGFDYVRIPATWTCHMLNNIIDDAYFAEVEANVDNALAAGLKVILNTHHDSFETLLGDALKSTEDSLFYAHQIDTLWTQIAVRMKDKGQNLMFETFNEIHDGDDWGTGSEALFTRLNEWNSIALNAIRKTEGNNTTRIVGIPAYAANASMAISHLTLPNDANLAVSVHNYDPYNFCISDETQDWGSDADYAAIDDFMFSLTENFTNKGIKVYIGEFGCVKRNDKKAEANRLAYLKAFAQAARTYGISLSLWDNAANAGGNESHAYFDHSTGEPVDDAAAAAIKAITDGYTGK